MSFIIKPLSNAGSLAMIRRAVQRRIETAKRSNMDRKPVPRARPQFQRASVKGIVKITGLLTFSRYALSVRGKRIAQASSSRAAQAYRRVQRMGKR